MALAGLVVGSAVGAILLGTFAGPGLNRVFGGADPGLGEPPQSTVEAPVAAARLDSAGLVALADVQAVVAAY